MAEDSKDTNQIIAAIERAVLGWVNTTPIGFSYDGGDAKISIEFVSNPSDFGDNEFGQAFPPPNGQIQINGQMDISLSPEPIGRSC